MSQSTTNAAATVLDLSDQQILSDSELFPTDAHAEQAQSSQDVPAELFVELPASDAPEAEAVDAARKIEARPAIHGPIELAPDSGPTPELNLNGDVLGQQLEQLVESVSVVEELSRRARETAASDLARYEALLASQQQYAERLDLARSIRDQARTALERAFGQEARVAGESLLGQAEHVLQAFAQLAEAWRQQASTFLSEHPDVDLLLAERRHQEEQERLWDQLAARARQLDALVANIEGVIVQGLLADGRRLIAVLERDFPEEAATIEQLKRKLAHSVRAEKDAAAWQALAQATEHQARGDLEAAVTTLEQVDVHGVSQDVSEDVFGRWSDACSRLAQSAGAALVRFAPVQGRGLILYADPAYPNGLLVFSSLGMGPGFPQGKVITDVAILRRARPFREAAPLPATSWATFASSPTAPTPPPAAPIRH